MGQVLVEACGVERGQKVLDVAAGTGNTAIRAAERGAEVVASDLTPENFPAGIEEARGRGVELDWVEADAEASRSRRSSSKSSPPASGQSSLPTTGPWPTSS